MKCPVHPTYMGYDDPPESSSSACVCEQIWENALDDAASNRTFRVASPRIVESADSLIEAAMARKDPDLHRTSAPAGYALRGASTMNRFNEDGTVTPVLQWVKTKDTLDPKMLVEIAKGAILADPIPAAPVVQKLHPTSNELETLICMGDPHFGMLAWDKETDEDWDVDIARDIHTKAIRRALELSPPSSRLIILNLGDAVHADGNNAMTTAGTRVDVDSRWPKVVGIFVETMNLAITEGLQKHDHVEMVTIPGNHDSLTAIVIRMILAERWRNNPRVTIADNLKMIWGHRFGSNLICAMHGDKTRLNNIPILIAQDYRKDWGQSEHAIVYAGHVHHAKRQEFPGIEVEYFRTLASKDQWHHASGYRSKRSLRCDVFHHEHGRILMHEIGIESL